MMEDYQFLLGAIFGVVMNDCLFIILLVVLD